MKTNVEYEAKAAPGGTSIHSALRGLFVALCLGRERLFVMLSDLASHCDEFGHADDPTKKVMGIAGLLGWSSAWSVFHEEWEQIRAEEGIPNPFHMVDFVHHAEKFKTGWESPEKRARVLNRLLAAIGRANVAPIGAAVVLADFNALTDAQRNRLRSPYYVAFQEVTRLIAFAAADTALTTAINFSQAKVSMVYARARGYTGPAEELWNEVKRAPGHLGGYWMSSYTTGEPSDYTPLQAADLWAYSLGHILEHQPHKNNEAHVAFDFFVRMALQHVSTGKFFILFDRHEMLMRLGDFSELGRL